MNYLLFVLLGVVLWQLITFVVMAITGENEDVTMRVGCGIPLIIFNSITFVIRNMRKMYIRKNYIVVQIWNDNGSNGKPYCVDAVRVKKHTLHNYYFEGENTYYIKQFTPKGKCIENCENIRKVRKNGWFCQEWINDNLVRKYTDTRY